MSHQIPNSAFGLSCATGTSALRAAAVGVLGDRRNGRGGTRSWFGCDRLRVERRIPVSMAVTESAMQGATANKPHAGPAAGSDPGG